MKWTREERKQINQRTRKLMTMHKALHPRDDVDRLYVSRKEGGRLEDYIEKHKGGLITATRNYTDNIKTNRMTITRKKWEEKQLYGHFKRLITYISHEKNWTWLRKGNHKRETESLLISAQNNTIRINHIKARIRECSELPQKEYKTRHNWVDKVIHREMCKKFKFDQMNKWYMHNPASVLENDTHKLLWNFDI